MSTTTAVNFLEILEKSGLVAADQLDELFGTEYPADAAELANALVRAEKLTVYQAKQLLAGKHRGFFLGPYKVLRPLGKGGMGVVFLGEHTSLDRKVALKVLSADQAKDKLNLDRFLREARAVAALDHPNIVRLHDISQGAGVHFLVMEFVDGNDLQTLMGQTGPLHYAQAAQYVAQAAAGLQHAHDKGFVHRDVKPANLILSKDGTVKILDMGLARTFHNAKDNLTAVQADGEIAGTVDFLSPEQAMNQPLDERSDVYSLGATLYTLLTGHPPFGGSTAQKLAQHQMKEPPAVTKKLNGRVPPALSAVISRMMAKGKADRFQTMTDVIDALGPWLPAPITGSVVHDPVTRTDLPSAGTKKSHPAVRGLAGGFSLRARMKERPVAFAAGAVGLLVAVGGLVAAVGGSGGGGRPAPSAPPAGPPLAAAATPADAPAPPTPAAPAAASATPAGHRVVYALDLSGQKEFTDRGGPEAGKGEGPWVSESKTGEGQLPDGWSGFPWYAGDVVEYFADRPDGKPAIGYRGVSGKGSVMLTPPLLDLTADKFRLRVEYQTQAGSMGGIAVFFRGVTVHTLPPTNGEWKLTEVDIVGNGMSQKISFHNRPAAGAPNPDVRIRTFAVYEPTEP